MDYTNFSVPEIENPHGFNWLYPKDLLERTLEVPPPILGFPPLPLDISLDFNSFSVPSLQPNSFLLQSTEFKDFDDISDDLFYWENNTFSSFCESVNGDRKPFDIMGLKPHSISSQSFVNENANPTQMVETSDDLSTIVQREQSRYGESRRKPGRTKSSGKLELEEIKRHFDKPITKAAKDMKVGLTILKKRCRELNIMRWPHRKIKSLKTLISNVKELGLADEVGMLEQHKSLMEIIPDMELTERTKKLRQACFKANYKRRRSMASLCSQY